MRTTRISPRAALFIAAVAAPLTLAAGPAWAGPVSAAPGTALVPTGISVSATGSVVQVTTTDCPDGGKAALMGNGNASFAGGEQVDLAGGGTTQSATWQGVSPGTYTVAVICTGGASAGSQRVTVSGTAPTTSPTTTARPTSPSGQVRGGLGGGAPEDTGAQIIGGAALALAAGLGGTWVMRRRRSRGRHS
ncbi:hypothetical protein [Streptomyces boluensis]|uniref:Uncharacterized protein n=1 Tax=Streptomyces boluensis TaxID=1775135 RepID=A0A964UWX7_9ACTN|nr:hypothetical protein [Streptomyces boluensis]NBE54362.1 hypothetical protein [Streptomyces boluensis]